MKKNPKFFGLRSQSAVKLCRIMKLSFLMLIGFVTVTTANTYSQQTKLSLELEDATLIEIFREIESLSDFGFFFKSDDLNTSQRQTIKVDEKNIYQVLDEVLENQNVEYSVEDKNVIIKKIISLQQDEKITIKGKVSDNMGEAIPGATVTIKGTTVGTITDIDGYYSLAGVKKGDILLFSFVGMTTKEISIVSAADIDVELVSDVVDLDEIVAIGYGTTTKRKAVGAISTMKAEQLENTPFMNAGESLQGQVPGLVVQNSGGAPGSKPSISIRGAGEPLYVIDGVMTNEQDFNAINSEDIESISFLKDASATAVYGSRAGNGIVLVTTKRGEGGKVSINYSYNYQMSEPTVLPEMLDSYEYAMLQNKAAEYDGDAPVFSNDELEKIRTQSDPDSYPDNNWPDLALKNFAPQQRHNLSMTGGDSRTTYFVSIGYVDQGGIFKEDIINYNRFNTRSNITTKFDKIGLELGVNLNASLETYQEPHYGMYSMWRAINQNTSPLYRAYNLDGTLAGGGNGDHPLALIDPDAGYNRDRDKFINAQTSLKWKVPGVKGLDVGVMANYRNGDGWNKKWEYHVPLYMQDGSLMVQTAPALFQDSYYSQRTYLETSINYANTFGKHGVEGTFVYNQTTSRGENMAASRWNYRSGAVDQLFAGPPDSKDNNGNEWEAASAGYVFRAKYDYNYKYIVEFSGRYDGNDNFAETERWGFFPAGSLAWNITEEDFMQGMKDNDIFNSLKLRASYGLTGVMKGVNRFGYIPVYNLVENAYNIDNTLINGFSEGNLVMPEEFTWYETASLNYGLDFSSLNNALSGTFEYFYYRTKNFLMVPSNVYSQPLGKSLPQINSKSAHRRAGFELSLRYKGRANQFTYEVGVNYAYFDQLWERLDSEDEATLKNPYTRQTHRTDYWSGGLVYQTDGLVQDGNDILNSPRLLSSTQTQNGDMRYQDLNGDGKIDQQDQRLIGKPSMPHSTYGIDFNLGYKGWFMNGLFQGAGERYMGFDNFMIVEAKRRTYKYQLDYWTPDNPNALFPRVSQTNNPNGGNNAVAENPSDFYLKNAKYFRLKNLQIGYDMKKVLLADVEWLASCRLFVNGTNLFTISPVKDYFDPEQVEAGDKGTQSYGYPVQRTYSFGLNVGF